MGFKLDKPHLKRNKASGDSKDNILQKEIDLFGLTFSNTVKEDFYIELSLLLESGVPLKDAMLLLKKGQNKKSNADIISDIYKGLLAGQSFWNTAKSLHVFTPYEFNSLKIGEQTGTLDLVTKKLGAYFKTRNKQKKEIISAMTYPMIILISSVLVVVFMLKFVVPMFKDVFKRQSVELPTITTLIVQASELLEQYGFILFISILLMVIGHKYLMKKQKRYRMWIDRRILYIPFFGKLYKLIYTSEFLQAMHLLTVSKIPIVTSLSLVKDMIKFSPLKDLLDQITMKMIKGQTFSESLSGTDFFDDKMVEMIKISEKTNQTAFIFERLQEQYSDYVARRSKQLATLVEPLVITLVGALVGFILIAMYLPMFKLSTSF